MVKLIQTQFNLVFSMLENLIENGSEKIWDKKVGGRVYFQQLLHTLMGINFWFRDHNEPFVEPFLEKKLYPELEKDPETIMTKEEMIEYKNQIKEMINNFFSNRSEAWLTEKAKVYHKLTNADIIFMQIRHVQYHVGYCNAVLYEHDEKRIEWIDFFG